MMLEYCNPQTKKKITSIQTEFLETGQQRIPIRDGIPRFVGGDGYVSNWSLQWKLWAKLHWTEENRLKSLKYFREHFRFDPKDINLASMKILDGGCGSGRLIQHFIGSQHLVWGVDFSNSVDFLKATVSESPNIQLAQADICQLPFEDGFFDIVYSSGVLIHVPDIEAAIQSLASKVRPGGTLRLAFAKKISPFIIETFIRETILKVYRIFTTRMRDERKILKFVDFLSKLYDSKIPFVQLLVPVKNKDEAWRKCYIHDFITAKYRKRQRVGRILKILRRLGFSKIEVYKTYQISICAEKPKRGED